MTGSKLSEIVTKNLITIGFSLFVISYYLLYIVRYLVVIAIRYALFGIKCSNYMNSKYSITTTFFWKYFEFYKPFINFIFISLDTIFYCQSV